MKINNQHFQFSSVPMGAGVQRGLLLFLRAPSETLESMQSAEKNNRTRGIDESIGTHNADVRSGISDVLSASPETPIETPQPTTPSVSTRGHLPPERRADPIAYGESAHKQSRPVFHPRNFESAAVPAGMGLTAASSLGAPGATIGNFVNPISVPAGIVGGVSLATAQGFREWAKAYDVNSKEYKRLKWAEFGANGVGYGATTAGIASVLPAAGALGVSGLMGGYVLNRWADSHPPGSTTRNAIRAAGNGAYIATAAGLAYLAPATLGTTALAGAGAYGVYGAGRLADKANEKLWGVKTGEHIARKYLGGQGFLRQVATAPVAAAAVPVGIWKNVNQWAHKVGWGHKPKSWWGKALAGTLGVPSAAVGIPAKRVAWDFILKPTYNVAKGAVNKAGGFLKYAFSDQSKGS